MSTHEALWDKQAPGRVETATPETPSKASAAKKAPAPKKAKKAS